MSMIENTLQFIVGSLNLYKTCELQYFLKVHQIIFYFEYFDPCCFLQVETSISPLVLTNGIY